MWKICLVLFLVSFALASKHTVHDISNIGHEGLETLKAQIENNHEKWIEVGDRLLSVSEIDLPVSIVPKVHISELDGLNGYVLLHNMGFAILEAPRGLIRTKLQEANPNKEIKIIPFNGENIVLAKNVENDILVEYSPPFVGSPSAVSVSDLINLVNQDRWFADVKTLASYNRYTKGTDIANAQKWIISQLAALVNVTVTTQSFSSSGTSGVNIIGTIKGSVTPNNWVIIGAHYDSTSQSPTTAAPGAEDDGSGAAAVIEMARVFNAYPPASTLLLILYSGEEQGLLGSAAHAQGLVNSGDSSKVKLMHDMDMIAYQKTPTAQGAVILETTTPYTSLFPYYRQSAQRFTSLSLTESTTAWGSDHESYLKRGMPALLTIDKDWDVYPSYHRTTDTPEKLNPNLGYQIIRLGVGAAAQVLGYSL